MSRRIISFVSIVLALVISGCRNNLYLPHKTYPIPEVYEATIRLYFDTEKQEDWAEYPGEFIPEFVWVDKGATITWVNVDTQQKVHTIISDDGLFRETIQPGGNFSFTFNSSGNFTYHCELYKFCDPWDMFGKIYVE